MKGKKRFDKKSKKDNNIVNCINPIYFYFIENKNYYIKEDIPN